MTCLLLQASLIPANKIYKQSFTVIKQLMQRGRHTGAKSFSLSCMSPLFLLRSSKFRKGLADAFHAKAWASVSSPPPRLGGRGVSAQRSWRFTWRAGYLCSAAVVHSYSSVVASPSSDIFSPDCIFDVFLLRLYTKYGIKMYNHIYIE